MFFKRKWWNAFKISEKQTLKYGCLQETKERQLKKLGIHADYLIEDFQYS
jgi:hypothetical protein